MTWPTKKLGEVIELCYSKGISRFDRKVNRGRSSTNLIQSCSQKIQSKTTENIDACHCFGSRCSFNDNHLAFFEQIIFLKTKNHERQ